MNLTEVYKKFSADFPEEAYSVDSSRGFDLTSLRSQYIIERLNEVVGITGWSITGNYEKADHGVLYIGSLRLLNPENKEVLHEIEAIGYSDSKKNTGDTYKSARTDALSKASSYLGIGNDMFKGKIAPNKNKAAVTKPVQVKEVVTQTAPTVSTDFKNRARTVRGGQDVARTNNDL